MPSKVAANNLVDSLTRQIAIRKPTAVYMTKEQYFNLREVYPGQVDLDGKGDPLYRGIPIKFVTNQ